MTVPMAEFKIITDSASDISQAEAKALQIEVLPLKTIFGAEEYLDGVTIDHVTFYNKLIENDVEFLKQFKA